MLTATKHLLGYAYQLESGLPSSTETGSGISSARVIALARLRLRKKSASATRLPPNSKTLVGSGTAALSNVVVIPVKTTTRNDITVLILTFLSELILRVIARAR